MHKTVTENFEADLADLAALDESAVPAMAPR